MIAESKDRGIRIRFVAQRRELGRHDLLLAGVEAQLDHLSGGVGPISWRGEPSATKRPVVHDHQPIAQLLGFVHVVGGQHQGHALLLEPVEAVPEQVAGLGVEPGRGLVEQQVRVVDQRSGDGEPPLHAARQRLDLVVGPLGQLGEVKQPRRPLARPRGRSK